MIIKVTMKKIPEKRFRVKVNKCPPKNEAQINSITINSRIYIG